MVFELPDSGLEIGKKARNLFLLKSLGLEVPRFCVLSFDALLNVLKDQNLNYTKKDVEICEIPHAWITEIESNFSPDDSFAVRSSSGVEDGDVQSFAGLFTTVLNVPTTELKDAIRQVWLSTFQSHLEAYRQGDSEPISISIIIQKCINADVSGVLFTADPLTNNKAVSVLNAVYGMGEGLVSGVLDADLYTINEKKEIRKNIQEKKSQFVFNEAGGLSELEVPKQMHNASTLTDEQIVKLSQIGKKIESYFGSSQDIEFCIKDNQLYVLQSRPISTLREEKPYLIWDNSNIVESYPGITLPLTFSFIQPVYAAVYKQMSAVLGISSKRISENDFTYQNMLGLLKGRVYYNLYSWYKLLSLLPGYSINASFMEKMMGVSERFELKDYKKPSGFKAYWDIVLLVFSMLRNVFRLPRMRKQFRKHFYEVLKTHQALNIPKADAWTCMHAYYAFEETLASEWKAPLVNDFFAMIYYGLFDKFIQKNKRYFEQDHNYYLSGGGKVITVEPARLQNELCKCIVSDPQLKSLFEENSSEVIHQWIEENPKTVFVELFHEYIETWGDRCFSELKLETISYRQDPKLFVQILKQTFHQTQTKHNDVSTKQSLKLPFLKSFVFKKLRKLTLETVSERENLRYERTRAFAEVRQIFQRLGDLFFENGIIDNARDIYYLSKEEVFNYIKGSSIQVQLKKIISIRKEEYGLYMDEPVQAGRIRTEDIVYTNTFESEAVSEGFSLNGIPCCKGIVRGRVRKLSSPDDITDLEGKIMVTMSTDPGWVSVFPFVSGLLVERGSVLSHAAIVSREMQIPCIVGIKGICAKLNDGDLIEMNGLTGQIKILSEDGE